MVLSEDNRRVWNSFRGNTFESSAFKRSCSAQAGEVCCDLQALRPFVFAAGTLADVKLEGQKRELKGRRLLSHASPSALSEHRPARCHPAASWEPRQADSRHRPQIATLNAARHGHAPQAGRGRLLKITPPSHLISTSTRPRDPQSFFATSSPRWPVSGIQSPGCPQETTSQRFPSSACFWRRLRAVMRHGLRVARE